MKHFPLLAVVLAALASCVQLYEHHRSHYRERWTGVDHDRNAHYRYGLLMAADLETGNVAGFFKDFDAGSWMWPPLNSVGVAAVALVAGPSPVTAIFPALLGYFLAAVFAFLLIRRVLDGWPGETPPHPPKPSVSTTSPSGGEVKNGWPGETPPHPPKPSVSTTSPSGGEVKNMAGVERTSFDNHTHLPPGGGGRRSSEARTAGGGDTASSTSPIGGWSGIFAGWLAAALVLLSPAHKAFATDVMLESLGAGLTLVVLHAFVVWSQARTSASSRWLSIALMLLFLEKYNYWVLALMAMVPVHLFEHRQEYLALLGRLKREVPWRIWLLGQFRRPLNYVIAVLLGLLLAYRITGGFTLEAFGKKLDVNNNQLLVTLAYALVLLRIAAWWWLGGRAVARAWLLPYVYPIIDWHILPAMTWLAIPHRFRNFLWYVASPTNTNSDHRPSFTEGLQYYWKAACDQYAPSPETVPVLGILALLSLALIFVPRFYRAGGWVVPAFALLSILSTVRHPNQQERFLHTGMAGVYVAAAVGLFGLLFPFPLRIRGIAAGIVFALAMAGLLTQTGPNLGGPGHASGLNVPPGGVGLRRATDAIQPLLNEGEPSAVFSNVPSKFWAMWLYLERWPRPDLLQPDCREIGVLDAPTAPQFAEWCLKTKTRRIVFVEVAKDSPLYQDQPHEASSRTILGFLPDSPFRRVQSTFVEGVGTISVWER